MINKDENPDFLNSFLDYTVTILNKSINTVKEYNYDIANFLKYIKSNKWVLLFMPFILFSAIINVFNFLILIFYL